MSSDNPGDAADSITGAWARERPDLPGDSIGIVTRIWHASKLLGDDRNRLLRRHDADPATLDLLSTLRRGGQPYRMSTGELAIASLIPKGAITQRVDRAEAQGYVRRVTAPGRKVAEVELTDRGRRVSDELVEAVLRHEEGLLAGLPQHERDDLAASLRRLLAHLHRVLGAQGDGNPGQVGTRD